MFLSPFFLIAAAIGAAVPLFLHFMQNRKKDTQPFPTLRFLKMADRKSSRRLRLENLLLWLLRTLIMLLLGFAFAMPMLRSQGMGWLGSAPRDVAIVLDVSFSMDYNTGRNTVWERAIDAATDIITGLNENDRYCIYLARENPEPLVARLTTNKEDGIARLQALDPGTGTSRLAPAAVEALRALEAADGNREREIHILTDNQMLPWLGFDAERVPETAQAADSEEAEEDAPRRVSSAWNPEDLRHVAVFVSLLGVSSPENIAPTSVELSPPLLREGMPGEARLTLTRTGRVPETTVTLFVNDEEIGRRSIRLDGSEGLTPSFRLPPLPQGMHTGRFETPEDNLSVDNTFHFLIQVAEETPPLVVGTPEDAFFVLVALRAGFGTVPRAIPPESITDEVLSEYPAIFLCNALPLAGQAIEALEQYVRTGGLLVIFPGMRAGIEAYEPWTCLPGIPTSIEELPRSERARTLSWDSSQHALLQPLIEGRVSPSISVRRTLRWDDLHNNTERLISMGAGRPFLLERPFGEGRVFLFAVSADRNWSDFPLSPYYLPLILQCAEFGSSLMASRPFIRTTETYSLSDYLPEARETSTLQGPTGRPVPIRSRISQGRNILVIENLTTPGIYRLSTEERPEFRPAIAVNLDAAESDLSTISPDNIRDRLGLPNLAVATDLEELRRLLHDHRIGRTFGEHLLWLALLLILIEFVYANFLFRRKPKLSEQLQVDLSGAVKGHVESTPTGATKA